MAGRSFYSQFRPELGQDNGAVSIVHGDPPVAAADPEGN